MPYGESWKNLMVEMSKNHISSCDECGDKFLEINKHYELSKGE
jgi:hypothetical protein